MNTRPQLLRVSARSWRSKLQARNLRGAKIAGGIVLILYPLFGVLDYFLASGAELLLLYGSRAAVTLVTVALLLCHRRPLFQRYWVLFTTAYMYTVGLGIVLMVHLLGGLASPYYAGLSLVMIGCGLLFVWPPRAAVALHSALFLSWLLPNLLSGAIGDPVSAISNGFFLAGSALIVAVGQIFNFQSLRRQYQTQEALEETKESLEFTHRRLARTHQELAGAHEALAGTHDQLERAHKSLRELDAYKSRFFANITHELKTPLALILSPIELLLRGELGTLSAPQERTLNSMQRSGSKLFRLINDLLDLSRLEESQLKLNVREHALGVWLRELSKEIAPLAERKGIRLSFDDRSSGRLLWCDPDRLERVVVNLLSNAVKFTKEGGQISLDLCHRSDRELHTLGAAPESPNPLGWLELKVKDNGSGFSQEVAERLFHRFYQTDDGAERKHNGTGIGLSLCRELISLHRGTIHAEGELGVGATFTVRLRLGSAHFDPELFVDAPATRGKVEAQVNIPQAAQHRLLDIAELTERRLVERDEDEAERTHTVLIVEDTSEITRLLHMALRRQFRVITAENGKEGIERLERFSPDLIISDQNMPEMTGLELLRRVRIDPRFSNRPFVLLTAHNDIEQEARALGVNADAYLSKPFSIRSLLKTVRGLIQSRASLPAPFELER